MKFNYVSYFIINDYVEFEATVALQMVKTQMNSAFVQETKCRAY